MNVVIIGTGNVAWVLGKLIINAGHSIVQVSGRSEASANTLAKELNCNAITSMQRISDAGDVYIIAVSDKAVSEVASAFNLKEKLVVHTAGSVSINVLQNASANYGVLYPLQSIRKEIAQLPVVPLLVDGCTKAVKNQLYAFAQSISHTVGFANDEQRLTLHIGAVITSNFTNHLYALAKTFCESENVSFKFLQPLIEETAVRIRNYEPEEMQTGPASRKDMDTVNKHLQLLEKYPQLQEVYKLMSESIIKGIE